MSRIAVSIGKYFLFFKFFSLPDGMCSDFTGHNCKFWTFFPTRKTCLLLSSCERKDEKGVVSGAEGCKVPSKTFSIHNLISAEVKCTVNWEPTSICPEQTELIAALGSGKITYFDAPPPIA